MSDPQDQSVDRALSRLDEATRLLASEMDETHLIERALGALAEFGQAERVAILLIDETGHGLEAAGGWCRGNLIRTSRHLPIQGTPLEEVIRNRRTGGYPLGPDKELPLPTCMQSRTGGECLCLPLIGNRQLVMGVVTVESRPGAALVGHQVQMLNVLATLLAVSLENARLFHLDGLTGLYARRYFEMRLEEEVARLGRHGGSLALLLTDFDQFKEVNDRYGHQQGDRVLSELAGLLKATVRKGVDLPCRYGGDEFVTILPVTDRKGACELAERVRRSCEEYRFASALGTVAITLSGGVATMDGDHLLSGEELVRRADAALYEAKAQGRNRICDWWDSEAGVHLDPAEGLG